MRTPNDHQLIPYQRTMVRALSFLIAAAGVLVGLYAFTKGPHDIAAYVQLIRDMLLTAFSFIAGVTARRAVRLASWLLLCGLFIYLSCYYAMTDVTALPSALLPLVIMILAAYTLGRRGLYAFAGGVCLAVACSLALTAVEQGPSIFVAVETRVALIRQGFQIALTVALVDRTIVILRQALTNAEQRRVEAEHLTQMLRDQAAISAGLQQRINKIMVTEASTSLASAVSHDLGNLLNVTAGYLEQAWENLPVDGGQLVSAIEGIENATSRAVSLNRRLYSIAKVDALDVPSLSINNSLPVIVPLLCAALGPLITLTLRVADGLAAVRCDEERLVLILLNLATNARDAMKGEGTVVLSAVQRPSGVLLRFHDDGPGIEERHREQIFAPFWTSKSGADGTGIGLYSSRQMAESVGGTLTLSDQVSERGACFSLCLADARSAV